MPPVTELMRWLLSSWMPRSASLTAAHTMSCSISTSSGSTAAGSISMLSIVWSPSAVTLTMPPPDVPVNDISLISSCAFASSACIF